MQFSIINTEVERFKQIVLEGGQVRIFAVGDIEANTADKFRAFVTTHNIKDAKVHFNSPGGSLTGGLRLGELIRDLGFDTTVQAEGWEYGNPPSAICASACAYAFAGGVSRFYTESAGRLGLHQFSLPDSKLGDLRMAQDMSGVLAAYLEKMGVKPMAFVAASTTDSAQMLWLTSKDAEEVGLANNGILPTTAEIKLANGIPYLRLEQVQYNVTARVILTCYEHRYSILGGIVTNPDNAEWMSNWQHRAYLEFDNDEKYVKSGVGSSKASDSTLWIDRDVSVEDAHRLLTTKTLGMWVENGGPMRRGAMIDLVPVHDKIDYYLKNCVR
jgi:hypothetical protein